MTIMIDEVDEKSLQASVLIHQDSASSPTAARNDKEEETLNPETDQRLQRTLSPLQCHKSYDF